jgi:hypothetical protein
VHASEVGAGPHALEARCNVSRVGQQHVRAVRRIADEDDVVRCIADGRPCQADGCAGDRDREIARRTRYRAVRWNSRCRNCERTRRRGWRRQHSTAVGTTGDAHSDHRRDSQTQTTHDVLRVLYAMPGWALASSPPRQPGGGARTVPSHGGHFAVPCSSVRRLRPDGRAVSGGPCRSSGHMRNRTPVRGTKSEREAAEA